MRALLDFIMDLESAEISDVDRTLLDQDASAAARLFVRFNPSVAAHLVDRLSGEIEKAKGA